MEYVIYIAITLIASYVAWALAPVPPPPKSASIDEFEVPQAEEGRPVGVVFGNVIIKAPTLAWYGDLSTEKIKQKSSKK